MLNVNLKVRKKCNSGCVLFFSSPCLPGQYTEKILWTGSRLCLRRLEKIVTNLKRVRRRRSTSDAREYLSLDLAQQSHIWKPIHFCHRLNIQYVIKICVWYFLYGLFVLFELLAKRHNGVPKNFIYYKSFLIDLHYS